MGTLYLVPTPLGNLEDITLRALRVLREVDLIATEDTRTTGRLLKHFDIQRPLVSYHEHSGEYGLDRVLDAVAQGDVALVSDAGTPLLSDPGYKLARAVIEQGFDVVSLPGPSAITTAVSASGLPTDRFLFAGFLPRKGADRRRALTDLATQSATLVLFESPHRLRISLTDMVTTLGGDRAIAVCRELTKLYEEIWRGSLSEALQEWSHREPRGEFTLVVSGVTASTTWDEAKVEAALAEALAAGETTKDAVKQVTTQCGWSKRDVYALAQRIFKPKER